MLAHRSRLSLLVAAIALAVTATSCSWFGGSDDKADTTGSTAPTSTGAGVTIESAETFGGMDALIAAAQKEGSLTVIGMATGSANWGEVLRTFRDKYQIAVNSVNPDSGSAAQVSYAASVSGQPNEPDVFNVEAAYAAGHSDDFAGYRVQSWEDVPAAARDADARWTAAYSGVLQIGYATTGQNQLTGLGSLQDDAYRGHIALPDSPEDGGAALASLMMLGAATGSGPSDIATGTAFVTELRKTGMLTETAPSAEAVKSGAVTAAFDWSFNQAATAQALKADAATEWGTFTPANASIGAYFAPAVNKKAQHPAAARLFLEYVFSADAANLMAAAGARPTLADALQKAGTLDAAAVAALPAVDEKTFYPTAAQYDAAIKAASGK